MQVQMGNPRPHDGMVDHDQPCVWYWGIDDSAGYTHETEDRPNGKDALIHVLSNPVTRLPGHEAFVSVTQAWPSHSPEKPTWVWSDNEDLAAMLAEAYDCPIGVPENVEDTHHTHAGPPGVGPVVPTESTEVAE